MKKLCLVTLVIAALVIPMAGFSQQAPSVKVGGKIKWLYAYQAEDDNALGYGGDPVENFSTTNVEVDISGSAGEKVSYLIELQAAANNAWWWSSPDEMGPIGVRQAKIMVSDLIPMTTVTLGTFNLPVGNYQPRATNDWDLIMLPLLNIADWNYASGASWDTYVPIGLGWQATGVNFGIAPSENISLDIAYFNGYAGAGNNPNVDIDLEKSWLVNLKVKVAQPATLAVAYLSEGWQEPTVKKTSPPHQNHTVARNASGYVVSGSYVNDKVEANFDWLQMTAPEYINGKEDLQWTGYQVTGGYWVTDKVEILGRYEWIDPDTRNKSHQMNNYDQLTWATLGVNIRLNECSEVAVNYIWRMEQGDEIDTDAGDTPDVNPKYQVVSDDLFLIQVQVWQ